MRSIPTAVTTGFTSNLAQFWLVKIQGSGGNTYYWTTASKNLDSTPQTLVLKQTSGGSSLTYDAGMIAKSIDGRPEDGIGQMESGMDVYEGGGLGFVGDIDLTILNQERFDSTINANEVNLENRTIEVFWGFIPTGATPTVVIEDDMLLRWSGIVADVLDQDYTEFVLRCEDGSYVNHEEIPSIVIERETYPNAPKESLGEVVPWVYGSFYSNENDERDFETLSPAPTVKIHDSQQIFAIADHELHTAQQGVYVFDDGNEIYGWLSLNATDAYTTGNNLSDGATAEFEGIFYAVFRKIPREIGSTTSVTITDISNAVDEDNATVLSLAANERAMFQLDNPEDNGELQSGSRAAIRIRHGTITGSGGKIQHWNGSSFVDALTNPDYNSTLTDTTTESNASATISWDVLQDYQFGVLLAAGQTGEIRHIVIQYAVRVFQLFKQHSIRRRAGLRREL